LVCSLPGALGEGYGWIKGERGWGGQVKVSATNTPSPHSQLIGFAHPLELGFPDLN